MPIIGIWNFWSPHRRTERASFSGEPRPALDLVRDVLVIGWLWEVALSFLQGRGSEPGFLNGPYCPIYGTGALLVVHLLETYQPAPDLPRRSDHYHDARIPDLGRWWDYSDKPLNINGRVYATGSIVFGLLSLLVIRFVQPWFSRITALLSPALLYVIAGTLALIVSLDLTYSVIHLVDFKHILAELHKVQHPSSTGLKPDWPASWKTKIAKPLVDHAFPPIRFDKLEEGLKRF